MNPPSYRYSDGTTVDPPSGPSTTMIHCDIVAGTAPAGLATPNIVWRAGLDLNPLDPADPGTVDWLSVLVWPEHENRRNRLRRALAVAASDPPTIHRADLLDGLQGLLNLTPSGATVVVQHSATFAYLDANTRIAVGEAITASGARWISFEGRSAVPTVGQLPAPRPDTLFVAALDRMPVALADGHGNAMTLLEEDSNV